MQYTELVVTVTASICSAIYLAGFGRDTVPSLLLLYCDDTPRQCTVSETTVSVAPLVRCLRGRIHRAVRPDRRGPEPSHREPTVGRAMV